MNIIKNVYPVGLFYTTVWIGIGNLLFSFGFGRNPNSIFITLVDTGKLGLVSIAKAATYGILWPIFWLYVGYQQVYPENKYITYQGKNNRRMTMKKNSLMKHFFPLGIVYFRSATDNEIVK